MNAKRVNAAADVIFRAQKNGHVTAAGWAAALESAQMLQSPESAAEMKRLRTAYDAVSVREHELIEERDALLVRIAELESQVAALTTQGEVLRNNAAERSADKLTQLLAPAQALREVPDGEHYPAVHHAYRLGHDLPEPGGTR
jgi:hypothetical protein